MLHYLDQRACILSVSHARTCTQAIHGKKSDPLGSTRKTSAEKPARFHLTLLCLPVCTRTQARTATCASRAELLHTYTNSTRHGYVELLYICTRARYISASYLVWINTQSFAEERVCLLVIVHLLHEAGNKINITTFHPHTTSPRRNQQLCARISAALSRAIMSVQS